MVLVDKSFNSHPIANMSCSFVMGSACTKGGVFKRPLLWESPKYFVLSCLNVIVNI